MTRIRNAIRVMCLRVREWKLEAEAAHTAALIADYQAMYAREMAELKAIRREIAMRTPAEVLLADVYRKGAR